MSDGSESKDGSPKRKADGPRNLEIKKVPMQNPDLEEEKDSSEEAEHFYELRMMGKLPERRGHHSSFIHAGKLYVFGGNDIKEGSIDSLWSLDMGNLADLEKR
jgi:hypothetical protein